MEATLHICHAVDLKNVNWRHGRLKPYVVFWIDPTAFAEFSTRVDEAGHTSPVWNEEFPNIPFHQDATLYVDIVHADAHYDTKPLVASASLPLKEIIADAGFRFGKECVRTLELKRPSGRPQGEIRLKAVVNLKDKKADDDEAEAKRRERERGLRGRTAITGGLMNGIHLVGTTEEEEGKK